MGRVYFSSVQSSLKQMLKAERIRLPKKFYPNFLRFISKACNYEEESKKIKPNLVLGFNLREAIIQVPNNSFIPFQEGKRDGSDLEKILKAILPFCCNGWNVFIDLKEDVIEYGLLRAFNGPKGLSATQILFISNEQSDDVNYGMIEISVVSSQEMLVHGLRHNSMTIDFRLLSDEIDQTNDIYNHMAEDITCDIQSTSDKDNLKKVFEKLMLTASQRVHGTICLVVKDDFDIPDFLKDGVWLKEPINLAEKALHTENGIDSEKYYGLSGLFLEMMNVDGITVIDSGGKIRGFNIFINQAKVTTIKVSGGARKRAAYTLLSTHDEHMLGVYFQSQDGNTFYERMHEYEQH